MNINIKNRTEHDQMITSATAKSSIYQQEQAQHIAEKEFATGLCGELLYFFDFEFEEKKGIRAFAPSEEATGNRFQYINISDEGKYHVYTRPLSGRTYATQC